MVSYLKLFSCQKKIIKNDFEKENLQNEDNLLIYKLDKRNELKQIYINYERKKKKDKKIEVTLSWRK